MEACDGSTLYTTHINKIKLNIFIINNDNNNKKYSLIIKNVYYYYKISTNLIFLKTLIRNGLSFKVFKKRLIITNNNKDTIIKGVLINTLFKLYLSDFNNFKIRIIIKALIVKKLIDWRTLAKF